MPAILIFRDKETFADGTILEMRLWRVPTPVPGSPHRFKYSLFFGRPGERIVGYDNERGKGDHRHLGDVESFYSFTDVETLVADFLRDVAEARERLQDLNRTAE